MINHLLHRCVHFHRWPGQRWKLWLLAAAGPLLGIGAEAQIRTDSSLGQATQTLTGPNYLIPQTLGKLAGNNLFHSFQSFNLATGEAANFSTTSPTLANVVSRVTGGELSQINGTIRLTAAGGATPAFFFINPAGVTFGAGASVDVPGAFHVSTANYLKFPDGRFHADTVNASTLSSAAPTAFGFLGSTRAAIKMKDAALATTTGALTLVAGDVEIDHAGVSTNSGDVRIVANGLGSAEVSPVGLLPAASGRLVITNGSYVYTEATARADGGNISLAAGDTSIRAGALVATASTTARPAGSITAELANLEIDGRTARTSTGITSQAAIGDTGAGGDVVVSVRDGIRILGGGMITSDTYGTGKGGNVAIKAGSLLLDGAGHKNSARITSRGDDGSAGVLTAEVAGSIELINGSQVSSDSFGAGKAGGITLRAGNDIRIFLDSFITSDAYGAGNAGPIDLSAKNLIVDATGGSLLTQVSSQALVYSEGHAGSIRVTTSDTLSLVNGGKIITDTYSSGNAGDVFVTTGNLLLDGRDYAGSTGIFSSSSFLSSGNGGTLNINVSGDAQILQSAKVSSSTWGDGLGGKVVFKANNLLIDGMGNLAGAAIGSEATLTSSSNGGSVTVDVPGHLRIFNIGHISAATGGRGNAGAVSVRAGQLTIDGQASGLAGIESSGFTSRSGNAGPVRVEVAGDVLLTRGGSVRTDTSGDGQGGDLTLRVGGDLKVEDRGKITSATGRSGQGGNVDLAVNGRLIVGAGGLIRSDTLGSGNAGKLDISASQVILASGGIEDFAWILSDSRGSGAAGQVTVKASKSIELAEGGFITSDAHGTGRGGSVLVSAPDIRIGGSGLLLGAAISSDTYSRGSAGHVEVTAQTLTIEGGASQYPTGVTSRSYPGASGNAGAVVVNTSGELRVIGGGAITSSTDGSGRGGEVHVKAASIEVSGADSQIGAVATKLSSGQAGNVTVQSSGALVLRAGATLSIENDGNHAQPSSGSTSTLTVQAIDLMVDGGAIKANSTGNVAAGTLQINTSDHVTLNQGSITTSANSGNGGSIRVSGGKLVALNNSQITTSVLGATGNGGDIQIGADALVLNSGFIQANTAANQASGGLVNIDVKTLIASGSTLFVGGQSAYDYAPKVFSFNVIQAAAPTGVSGAIDITSPVLDLSGSLGRLNAQVMDDISLGRNPCRVSAGSSLALAGRGGLPVSYRGLLRAQASPITPDKTPTTSAPPPAPLAKLTHTPCL
ncbi:beta strand repeat-containing protein [Rhodoferax sp.]|uniref:beta strand repeat-containing protein n=1 Tax=Rhodoferax sp. TaxID=50421 RepID=UPI002748C20D|nr:filamentous hemagglutinin N-terminal domain-containing protein [Rhodoferax sp.]